MESWNHGNWRRARSFAVRSYRSRRGGDLGAMSHQVARLHGRRPSDEMTPERVDGATSSASRTRARAEETSR